MQRVFVAIKLSERLKSEVSDYYYWRDAQLVDLPIKWVDKDLWHLTLAFIGEVTDDMLVVIKKTLREVRAAESISIKLAGVDCFVNHDGPRVLYIKVDSSGLAELARQIRINLQKERIQFDGKEFSAHLTIGRVKNSLNLNQKGALDNWLADNDDFATTVCDIDKFYLLESIMENGILEYKELAEYTI